MESESNAASSPAKPKRRIFVATEHRQKPRSEASDDTFDDLRGGDGDRTHYLLHAMQALYQLSYAPVGPPRYQQGPGTLGQ
jgi:hypothetical protein